MENPYKQPPKTCILCNITVDFKNVQVGKMNKYEYLSIFLLS